MFDLIQFFGDGLDSVTLKNWPVSYIEPRAVHRIMVQSQDDAQRPTVVVDNLGYSFKTVEGAIFAARRLADLISEIDEQTRADHASLYAHKVGEAVIAVQEAEDTPPR